MFLPIAVRQILATFATPIPQAFRYTHDFDSRFVRQQYLPDVLATDAATFWHPQPNAQEDRLAAHLRVH